MKELASKTGISFHTINHYLAENGSSPLAEMAVKIAQALNVSVEYLVTGKDSSTPKNIKPEVLELLNSLNKLSDENFQLLKALILKIERLERVSAK